MDLPRTRLLQQRLVGTPCARPDEAVAGLLAMQSQDFSGAKWAIVLRSAGVDDAGVQRAFDEGRILRTHVLRPTWHFVAPADIGWLLQLSAPRVHAANAYAYRQFGVDAATAKRSKGRIVKALERGEHLTRSELARVLDVPRGRGTIGGADAAGYRLGALLMWAELDGLICSGAMRDKQHTYALLEERAPRARKLGRDEALAELARRYVSGHGPAQAKDLAWWSGFTLGEAKRALDMCGHSLTRETLDGKLYFMAADSPNVRRSAAPAVHLLPNFDELLGAFKDRSAMLDPSATLPVSALGTHFVVIDGRIVGSWRRALAAGEVAITARLLRPLSRAELAGLERAAALYAGSLNLSHRLETTAPSTPRRAPAARRSAR